MFPMTVTINSQAQLNAVLAAFNVPGVESPKTVPADVGKTHQKAATTANPQATVGNGASSTAATSSLAPEAAAQAQDAPVGVEGSTPTGAVSEAAEQGKTAQQAVEALDGHANKSAPAVTYAQVATAITELAKTKGKPAAVDLLKSFGVARGPELKPEQYADVFAAANQAKDAE